VETADPAVPVLPDSERAEPIADWFVRMVSPAGLPHLHRVLPSLMAADCVADFGTARIWRLVARLSFYFGFNF
jgi:hypothetical protein